MPALARLVVCSAITLTMLAPAAVQGGGIPAKTVKTLKAATVYIKVQFKDAIGPFPATGSGFLLRVEGETGYIVTNDHVVSPRIGQTRDGNPKLVFQSGTTDEKTVEAEVVASDPVRDLAVLKVTGIKDLPSPIAMDVDSEATETMTVYSLGFPFGKKLALDKSNHPAINITRGSVTSLRSDSKGNVYLVQIDAEINPGNSGGPIVDDKGNLVGVAVSKMIEARTVGFAIPVKPVAEMMHGKVARVHFDTVQVDKDKAEVSIGAGLLNPLGKLDNVAIHYRALPKSLPGDKKDALDLPRADKDGNFPPLKDAKVVRLKVNGDKAVGTFHLERGETDQTAIIVQASYVNGAGKKILSPASITAVTFPKVIYYDKLTRLDPIDKTRRQPSKKYTHKMEAGKHYVIEMRGNPKEIDPWLILRDSSGAILAEDDDSGGYPNALIVYSPKKDDDYEITATVFKGDTLGPFTLRIREETGLLLGRNGYSKAGVLAVTDPLDPFLNAPAQTFNVILKKGTPCIIDMKSKDFDPFLRFENMAGVNLKFEDVGGEGHSTLIFTPLADGIYRVVASSFDYKLGAFELKLSEGVPAKQYDIGPDGLKIAANLSKTDPIDIEAGQLTPFRCKVYEVKMKGGEKYQLDLASKQFGPDLRIEDARGQILAVDRNALGKFDPRIIFSPPADGVFRVIVSQVDNRFGAFNLTIRSLAPQVTADAWFKKGAANAKLGKLDQAIADFSKTIEMAPTAATAFNERGVAYFRQGKWDKANADFTSAIELNAKNPVHWTNRADTFSKLGQLEKAIGDLSKAVELAPKADNIWNMRGLAYYRSGQWEKANADFANAIELNSKIAIYWSNRGDSFDKLNQWDKSISDCSKAIEINPDLLSAYSIRGSAHASLGRWEKASEDLTKVSSTREPIPLCGRIWHWSVCNSKMSRDTARPRQF